jgi:RIO kinase 1
MFSFVNTIMAKITREKFKTYEGVFDKFTIQNLVKLISQGHFEGLESQISLGKEAQVFSARTKNGSRVAIKIYRLETCDFNRMYEYIRYDPKFMTIKKQRRKVVFAWAKREFHNLLKLRQLGIKVPKPITILNNVLVMEFVGNDDPAPKLKDSNPKDLKKFFEKTISYMSIMAKENLVHSDLSEFNILNLNDEPVFIDVSQTMIINNLQAKDHQLRDFKNIARFFSKRGLEVSKETIIDKMGENLKTV